MKTRVILIATIAVAAAQAQPMGGRGAGGPGGPPPGLAGALGARFLGAEAGMPGRVVKNAPFSADIVTETVQSLPDGNRIKQSNTVRFYRDSEGRTRREQALRNLGGLAPNSTLPEVAFINDPVGGSSYALNLEKRTVTKSTAARGAFGRGAGPGSPADAPGAMAGGPRGAGRGRTNPNLKTESLGRQVVEGVQADGVRTTLTYPAGAIGNENPIQVVSETWYSPELQTYVLRKRSDPRSGETSTRYTNITRSEPSRMLFEPPADFKVVEPRGMMRRQ